MTTVNPPQTEINSLIALYSNGQIQEALDTVEALTKSYPNDPLLYNISGICYKTIGELDDSIQGVLLKLIQVVRLFPSKKNRANQDLILLYK